MAGLTFANHSLARLADRGPIASYGGGGFRFGETRLSGAALVLANGVYAWDARSPADLDAAGLAALVRGTGPADFFLFGCGGVPVLPSEALRAAFEAEGLPLEFMTTAAACRTYNLLLAEQRHFAAGLLAI